MATLTKSLLPISGYTNQYYTYQCVVTENSYSVANNTSNVTITFSIKGPWAPSYYEWATNYGIIVDGAVKKTGSSSPYVSTSYVQLLTWTGDIAHSSDGSKTINVGVYLYHNNTANYLPKQYTSSSPLTMGSVALTTIARASQPSIITWPNTTQNIGDIGSTVTIHMNRASSSFTHTVRYAFGSLSGNIATGVTNNCSWTIPTSFYAQIPSATSGTGTVYCDTYNGSTLIGTKSVSFTTTVSSSVVPTVGTITLTPQAYNYLVQNKNTVKVAVSGCSAGAGSGIKSYTFSGPGISTTTTSTSVTSSTMSSSGTKTYTVTVTDNRGRTASKTASITCYAWSAPSITLNAYRVASSTSTTENDSGTYVRCTYNLSYSSVNNTNDVTVKIYYKKNTASSWSSKTALTDSKNTSGNYALSSIAADSTYTVYATITDSYSGSSTSTQITIFSAERILNIRSNGTGIAFGKMAESDNLLDVKWPIKTGGSYVATMPTVLYSSSTGNIGTITLSYSAADYTYLEIYYTDNNGRQPNCARIYSPNGKYVSLSCIEPSTSGTEERMYIRTSGWTISGTSMTVGRSDLSGENRGVYGQLYPNANGTNSDVKVTANNYIKIFRVLGYK